MMDASFFEWCCIAYYHIADVAAIFDARKPRIVELGIPSLDLDNVDILNVSDLE